MRHGRCFAVVSASIVLSFAPGLAFAQSAPAGAAGTPNSAAGIAKKQGLADVTPAPLLLAPGIAMTLNYTEESAGNPIGGIRQGAAYAGQAFLGIDFDLKTLAHVDGGSLHVIVTQRHGNDLVSDYIGNNTSVQEVYGTPSGSARMPWHAVSPRHTLVTGSSARRSKPGSFGTAPSGGATVAASWRTRSARRCGTPGTTRAGL